MNDKFIKNLPYAITNCFIILLLYCSQFVNGITGKLYIVVCTLLFITPNQMSEFSTKNPRNVGPLHISSLQLLNYFSYS